MDARQIYDAGLLNALANQRFGSYLGGGLLAGMLDPNVVKRGSFWPVGRMADGGWTLALPQGAIDAANSLQSAMDMPVYYDEQGQMQQNPAVTDVALGVNMPGLLTRNPMRYDPNVLAMNSFYDAPSVRLPDPGVPRSANRGSVYKGYAETGLTPEFTQALDKGAIVKPSKQYLPVKPLDIQDLQGSYITNLTGDRTNVGLLTDVLGARLPEPVALQGGRGYMRGKDTGVWASAQPVITRIGNQVDQVDAPVYGAYTPMAGGSSDFAFMTGDVAKQLFDPTFMKKGAVDRFNKRIKGVKGGEGFPGLNSEKFDDWMNKSGKNRTLFYQQLGSKESYEDGLPDVAVVRHAIQDPELRDIAPGELDPLSGHTFGLLDPNKKMTPVSDLGMTHGTYPVDLAGEYAGDMAPVPRSILFRDAVAKELASGAAPQSINRKFQTKSYLQPVDQQLVDAVKSYQEGRRK